MGKRTYAKNAGSGCIAKRCAVAGSLLVLLAALGCSMNPVAAQKRELVPADDVTRESSGTSPIEADAYWGAPRPNVLPLTTLSASVPEPRPGGGYRFRLNWFGWDPDGSIDHYEYQITEDGVLSDWVYTVSTDSVMIIGPEVVLAWQLGVRAVDNEGEADPTPSKVTFLIPDEDDQEMSPVLIFAGGARAN
jgi:hypothetical protein